MGWWRVRVLVGVATLATMFTAGAGIAEASFSAHGSVEQVYVTNLALAALLATLMLLFGVWQVLLVHVPVIALTAVIGVGLFSLQHRFDDVVWARQNEWDVTTAALQGSSFFKLPRVLQWFTGNIGYHHVHHLSPRVPNYRLEACHNAIPAFGAVKPLSWRAGLKSIRLMLWDEAARQMVRFADVRDKRRRNSTTHR